MTTAIVIVDKTQRKADELEAAAQALTKQLHNHFSLPPPRGWGLSGHVRVATDIAPPKKDEWQLALLPEPDQPGALGDHDRTPAGLPLMRVFPLLDPSSPWTVTASHEILETLADPELARAAQAPDGKFWAAEICDAVEIDEYPIDGIPVSNFVLQTYFEPPDDLTGVKLDHLGLVKRPFEIRSGGYGQYWTGTRWREVVPTAKRASREILKKLGIGRAARRQAKTAPYEYSATVVRVIDGDTIVAKLRATFVQEIDLGFHIIDRVVLEKVTEQHLRLTGIDAPELKDPGGEKARDTLIALLGTGPLTVRTYLQDHFGRWLAEIWSGEININQAMIASGFAAPYKRST